MFVRLDQRCPYCARKKTVRCSHLLPRQLFDCRCGATLEVRPIKHTPQFTAWMQEWTPVNFEEENA